MSPIQIIDQKLRKTTKIKSECNLTISFRIGFSRVTQCRKNLFYRYWRPNSQFTLSPVFHHRNSTSVKKREKKILYILRNYLLCRPFERPWLVSTEYHAIEKSLTQVIGDFEHIFYISVLSLNLGLIFEWIHKNYNTLGITLSSECEP